jgi:hypothetical protein
MEHRLHQVDIALEGDGVEKLESPGRVLRTSWSVVVVYIAADDRGLLTQGLNRGLKISAGALAVDLGG